MKSKMTSDYKIVQTLINNCFWFSGQKKLDLKNGDINCQTLFYSGHTKSGTYILKDHSSEEPRIAYCNMEKQGLETEIQSSQVMT